MWLLSKFRLIQCNMAINSNKIMTRWFDRVPWKCRVCWVGECISFWAATSEHGSMIKFTALHRYLLCIEQHEPPLTINHHKRYAGDSPTRAMHRICSKDTLCPTTNSDLSQIPNPSHWLVTTYIWTTIFPTLLQTNISCVASCHRDHRASEH